MIIHPIKGIGINMKLFSIGGFYHKRELITILLDIFLDKPFLIEEDVRFSSSFDSFPNMIWNGGRVSIGPIVSESEVKDIIAYYNEKSVKLNFTFTNSLLTKNHLHDEFGNFVLDAGHNANNSIIVYSDLLYTYIKKNYPKYKCILSVTKANNNIDFINQALPLYDLVVLPPDLSKNYMLLEQINDLSKIEVLVNNYCIKDCPFSAEHYRITSEAQMKMDPRIEEEYKKNKPCSLNKNGLYPNLLSNDNINILYKMGIQNFKLSGRLGIDVLEQIKLYGTYLIKQEYRKDFFTIFTEKLFDDMR